MAMFSGIGRGLTSMGLGMERNRIRSEDLSQREAEREDARAYNRTLMEDQENRRVAALKEARTYGTEQEEARRVWETQQDEARQRAGQIEFDRRAGVQRTQAADAATTAAGVVDARVAREEELRAQGVEGLQNVMRAGEWKGTPYPSTAVYDPATAEDRAAVHFAGLPTATPRTPVQPPIGLVHLFQDEATTFDPETGDPVGRRGPADEAYNRARGVVNQPGYVAPPLPFESTPSPFALPGTLDQSGRSPAPRRDAGGGTSPGITPDMLDMFDRQGWSLEDIDRWLDARGMSRPPVQRRGRGGR